MTKPHILRRRSRSSDARPVSSLSPSGTSPPSNRTSSQGPPNFFYQDPTTHRATSPYHPPNVPVGPNAHSPSGSSSSPSSAGGRFPPPSPQRNGLLAPPTSSPLRPQPPQQAPPPVFVPPPRRASLQAGVALPGAPPLLAIPMTRSGGSSTSLSSDRSGGSGYSSFKDEEVEDLADSGGEEDFILPVQQQQQQAKGGGPPGDHQLANGLPASAPPTQSGFVKQSPVLRSPSPVRSHPSEARQMADDSVPRARSPQYGNGLGPRLPTSDGVPPPHARTPSGSSIIAAAPLSRNGSSQNVLRAKLPPLTTEFVDPSGTAPLPPPKAQFDFFADTPDAETYEAREQRYKDAAAAELMTPQSTYSQSSPAMGGQGSGGGELARALWGEDHPGASGNDTTTNPDGEPLPLPPPRHPARPLSMRTSRPLGSPTKPPVPTSTQAHPPPPRYTSPPPKDIYSPITPTPSNPQSSLAGPSSATSPFVKTSGYTSSPSFNLPHIPVSTSQTFGSPPLSSHFDAGTFSNYHPGDIATLSSLLGVPRILKGVLDQLDIVSVLRLWEASSQRERRAMDGNRYVREEVRVWGLGWAGYMRGGLDRAGTREGWATCSTGTVLDFLSTLSLPPNAILPPHLVLATSTITLLLRTSHSLLPPPGPHLIPFQEEDFLPAPLQGLHPSLPPSARTRALPNGRELVFPAPLASAVDLAAQDPTRSPSQAGSMYRSDTGSMMGGSRKLRRRSSISSVMSGVTWGAGRGKANGGPPSSFNNSRIVSSSASIHSVAPSTTTRVQPPTPHHPEPRRYEFSQQPLHAPRSRPTNDSRMSLDSYARGGGSSIYSTAQSSHMPRTRSSTTGGNGFVAPNGFRPDGGQNGNGNIISPTSVYHDPDAPPMPNLSNPAFRKHSSRESSMTNLASVAGGGRSTSPSFVQIGANGRPAFAGRSSSPSPDNSSENSSNPNFSRRNLYPHPSSSSPRINTPSPPQPVEPLFLSSTSPFRFHRAPIVRIVVPLPRETPWPSGAALKMCHRELDASGLLSKMKFGDLVENLAVSHPRRVVLPNGGWTTGGMVFIPPFLHPLSFAHSLPPPPTQVNPATGQQVQLFRVGHLPPTLDAFLLPPSYYHAVLPLPYVVWVDLSPFGQQVGESLRLAHQRTELPSSRGEILSVDVWIHEAAFVIGEGGGDVGGLAKAWEGTTVILEADGTKEGKDELLDRIRGTGRRPWEILGSKSTRGSVWLKLVRETIPEHVA